MLYNDRFAGHFDPEDPRTPVSAAGGCPWPTVPAYRYQLSSTNSTGNLAFLQWAPIILELQESEFQHNLAEWHVIEAPYQVYSCVLYKAYNRDLYPEYSWQLALLISGWPDELIAYKWRSGPCNVDLTWGNISNPYPGGTFGTDFKQFQVEFDQLRHPNWMPPA